MLLKPRLKNTLINGFELQPDFGQDEGQDGCRMTREGLDICRKMREKELFPMLDNCMVKDQYEYQ